MNDAVTATPADASAAPAAPVAASDIPAGRSGRAIMLFVAMTVVILAADLVIKYAAFRYVAGDPIPLTAELASDPYFSHRFPHDPVPVVPGVLNLQLTTNTGAVFGLGKGGRWLFVVVSVVALAIIGRIFWRSPARATALHMSLALILAGALGNLYDRVVYSAVRDMFHLFPGSHLPFGFSWPDGSTMLYPWIFNLADAALIVGVLGVLIITWANELRRPKPERAAR